MTYQDYLTNIAPIISKLIQQRNFSSAQGVAMGALIAHTVTTETQDSQLRIELGFAIAYCSAKIIQDTQATVIMMKDTVKITDEERLQIENSLQKILLTERAKENGQPS